MIYIFLADGFEEIEAITPIDLLRRAGKEVKIVGVGNDIIKGRSDIKIVADIVESDVSFSDEIEMIILPGGLDGVNNLSASKTVQDAIKFCVENDKFIAAICAAPYIIGKMSLLSGREATCYPGFEKELIGAKISEKPVVTDGKFITAKSAGQSTLFAYELILNLCGKEKADEVMADIIYFLQ